MKIKQSKGRSWNETGSTYLLLGMAIGKGRVICKHVWVTWLQEHAEKIALFSRLPLFHGREYVPTYAVENQR